MGNSGYRSVKIKFSTYQRAKVLAAERGIGFMALIDELVMSVPDGRATTEPSLQEDANRLFVASHVPRKIPKFKSNPAPYGAEAF